MAASEGTVFAAQAEEVSAKEVTVDHEFVGMAVRPDGPGEVAEIEPEVDGPLLPFGPEFVDGDGAVLVRSIGVERGRPRAGSLPTGPRSLPVLVHRGRPLREEPAQAGVDADDVAQSRWTDPPGRTHAVTQFEP
jgi:hypothetical protein